MKRTIVLYGLLSSALLQAQNVSVTYSSQFSLLDKGLMVKHHHGLMLQSAARKDLWPDLRIPE